MRHQGFGVGPVGISRERRPVSIVDAIMLAQTLRIQAPIDGASHRPTERTFEEPAVSHAIPNERRKRLSRILTARAF